MLSSIMAAAEPAGCKIRITDKGLDMCEYMDIIQIYTAIQIRDLIQMKLEFRILTTVPIFDLDLNYDPFSATDLGLSRCRVVQVLLSM